MLCQVTVLSNPDARGGLRPRHLELAPGERALGAVMPVISAESHEVYLPLAVFHFS